MFGDQAFFVERPGLPDLTEEQCEAELDKLIQLSANPDPDGKLQSVIDAMTEESAARMMTNPGDGQLTYDPLMCAEDRQLAFDGFEKLLSGDRVGTQSKLTDTDRTAASHYPGQAQEGREGCSAGTRVRGEPPHHRQVQALTA